MNKSKISTGCRAAKSDPRSRSGFTLIEMLVVIAIIGLLASLLVPATSAALEKAKTVQCQSNLRQIGIAMSLFAVDHKNSVPDGFLGTRGRLWQDDLADYVGTLGLKRDDAKIFHCPIAWNANLKQNHATYALTMQTIWHRPNTVDNVWNGDLSRVKDPTNTILVAERIPGNNDYVRPSEESATTLAFRHGRNIRGSRAKPTRVVDQFGIRSYGTGTCNVLMVAGNVLGANSKQLRLKPYGESLWVVY